MPIELLTSVAHVQEGAHDSTYNQKQRYGMNISDSIKKLGVGVDKPVLDKGSASKSTQQADSKTEAASDNVTLSATSVQLQSLETGLSTGEVFDANKVEEIKAAIARGDFSVDTAKVADGLLQTVKDLIKPNKG